MERHQNPSPFSSSQQLLEELENLIWVEFSRNGNPWISVAKLSGLFHENHGVLLEYTVQSQGYSHSLRSFLKSSKCFSIYGTSTPQEFYVTLLRLVVPDYDQNQTRPIQYRIKRSWKVDGKRLRLLETEGAQEILSRQPQRKSAYQPILVPKIKTVDDLEMVLIEIINYLTINLSKPFATVSTLSKRFYHYYRQPIRSVMRSVCPDMTLIDLLQTIPSLQAREGDNGWQISLKADSIA